MNVVDSSGWLEYFSDTNRARFFQKPIEDIGSLIVPAISIYEVFKKILSFANEDTALTAVAHMQMGQVVDLDTEISINAAKISHEFKIPMADSIILATSIQFDAILWTQDEDFRNYKGKVKYFPK